MIELDMTDGAVGRSGSASIDAVSVVASRVVPDVGVTIFTSGSSRTEESAHQHKIVDVEVKGSSGTGPYR